MNRGCSKNHQIFEHAHIWQIKNGDDSMSNKKEKWILLHNVSIQSEKV